MVQMLTLPFIFDNKCHLPWTCDEFHRHEPFVIWIFSFSTLLYFDFVFIYFPVVLFNSLVPLLKRMNGHFFSFSSPENVEKCEVCCSGKLV